MQNKKALIDYIASRMNADLLSDLRTHYLPSGVLMRDTQYILRRHRDDLVEAGRFDDLDIPQMIDDTLYIDDEFVAELLELIDNQPEPEAEVEHAVVAGDCIAAVGETPAEAAELTVERLRRAMTCARRDTKLAGDAVGALHVALHKSPEDAEKALSFAKSIGRGLTHYIEAIEKVAREDGEHELEASLNTTRANAFA